MIAVLTGLTTFALIAGIAAVLIALAIRDRLTAEAHAILSEAGHEHALK